MMCRFLGKTPTLLFCLAMLWTFVLASERAVAQDSQPFPGTELPQVEDSLALDTEAVEGEAFEIQGRLLDCRLVLLEKTLEDDEGPWAAADREVVVSLLGVGFLRRDQVLQQKYVN